jgi:hypothetical protein
MTVEKSTETVAQNPFTPAHKGAITWDVRIGADMLRFLRFSGFPLRPCPSPNFDGLIRSPVLTCKRLRLMVGPFACLVYERIHASVQPFDPDYLPPKSSLQRITLTLTAGAAGKQHQLLQVGFRRN